MAGWIKTTFSLCISAYKSKVNTWLLDAPETGTLRREGRTQR